MFLMDESIKFCTNTANAWQVVGYILLAFRIIVPILLIIFGMVDLGKAVTGSKEDDIKKATFSLMRRAIAAVVIFFVPTIVSVIMGLITDFGKVQKDYDICRKCITNPNGPTCSPAAKTAWGEE